KSLKVHHFRSHSFCDLNLVRGMFAIVGPNGIGKTNLLEAIALTTLGRSFRTENLKEILKEGQTDAEVTLQFEEDLVDHEIRYRFGQQGKEIRFNQTAYKSYSPLLGVIPVGIVCPKDVILIEGGPQFRRKYLNQILCQASKEYAFHLKRYTHALEQKNAALKAGAIRALDPYEEILDQSAKHIQLRRFELLEELQLFLKDEERALMNQNETIDLRYAPSKIEIGVSMRAKELERRTTLSGPHRDDFEILLNNKEASIHASEGQKRAMVLALRFAELSVLKIRTEKNPLLLIDDFGAHLDPIRTSRLLERTKLLPQSILTSPEVPQGADAVYSIGVEYPSYAELTL
ncbi:MAG: DNA replication and repair protein RecF, partial [Chlamydiae bacterium]|nr:DNA replication and repair protein RecF [Chlamydiota bacterium]